MIIRRNEFEEKIRSREPYNGQLYPPFDMQREFHLFNSQAYFLDVGARGDLLRHVEMFLKAGNYLLDILAERKFTVNFTKRSHAPRRPFRRFRDTRCTIFALTARLMEKSDFPFALPGLFDYPATRARACVRAGAYTVIMYD